MSYSQMLSQRCNIVRLTESQVDGLVSHTWQPINTDPVRCFLDLNFIRLGKDPTWTPDTGTAQNRAGVLFLPTKFIAQPGDRIQMLLGPSGTFKIERFVDEAWTPKRKKPHHLELYVTEVDRALAES